jgi:hypothetical protein
MKQFEAIISVMESNGGFATLGYLYQNALKIPGVEWKTKTPFASMRRIVQDNRYFFKIKPGLWALNSYKNQILRDFEIAEGKPTQSQETFSHTYFQGLLVEIGNLKGFCTFIPSQDKNKIYLSKPIGQFASNDSYFEFTYPEIVRKAKSIDVSWFNVRRFPASLFEVEHTTSMETSLIKFSELQDFRADFNIVADKARKREFEQKIKLNAFAR